MDKRYFSYIRVSTTRQGQTGTSLIEQREAIRRYAERFNLSVIKEYEEQETAAKRGRPIFSEMLKGLKDHKADGIVIHKIDRSARNLKDWADLGEMIDSGIEVHFANESLDLHSRGGRLSADIQAVVAADYIRNLREETKKGFYGRIKQGLYPMPAPLGYLDRGQGQAKALDPSKAPIVKEAFDLYATGEWGIAPLVKEMYARGLRTKGGKKVTKNGLHKMLHNPFYTGLIRLKISNELFPGKHEPLISQFTFDRVQKIMRGKYVERHHSHAFLFRKNLTCAQCQATLIGERQKGYVYYRCQAKECPQKTIREEIVEESFTKVLKGLQFSDFELRFFHTEVKESYRNSIEAKESQAKSFQLQREQISDRLSKLTDAYIDGVLEKDMYIQKKNNLLYEEQAAKERLANLSDTDGVMQKVEAFLELANNAYLSYQSAIFNERRELVKTVTSNFTVENKTVLPKLHYPFQLVAERYKFTNGGPQRDVHRTLSPLLKQLLDYFRFNEIEMLKAI